MKDTAAHIPEAHVEMLCVAIHRTDADKVSEMLRANPGLATAERRGLSMLVHAVQAADPQQMPDQPPFANQHRDAKAIIKALLDHGADPDELTPGLHPETLLHLAARTGAKSAVEALLEQAKPNQEKQSGEKGDTALLASIDALVHLPCIVHNELRWPVPSNGISAAWNAQAKGRNIARSYLDCIKLLTLHSNRAATVKQRLSTPVYGVPEGAEVNVNALWMLISSCAKSLWLDKNLENYPIWERLIDLADHADVNARLTLATSPATPIGDSLLQHVLRNRIDSNAFHTLLNNGAEQDVEHPLHPGHSVRDYYQFHAPADDNFKKSYDHVRKITEEWLENEIVHDGLPFFFSSSGQYDQSALHNGIKTLAEFDLLHRLFEFPVARHFKSEKERLQTALKIEALLPASRKGTTGPYTMRQAPLTRPDDSATVTYLRGEAPTPTR